MSVSTSKSAPPMSKKRQLRRLTFLVAVPIVAALIYLLPVLVLREPILMDKARKVLGTDASGYSLKQFLWQPNGAIIERRQANSFRAEIARVDPKTGANVVVSVLDRQLSHSMSNYTLDTNLSPDGQALLLRETRNRMVRYSVVPTANGLRQGWLPVPLVQNHEQVWLPDSRSWLELVQAGKTLALTVHPLSGPRNGATLALPWNAQAWPGCSVNRAGVLLTAAYVDAPPPDYRLHCWRITTASAKIETQPFTLPMPGSVDEVGDAALSPQGDRVVFGVLRLAKPNPILKWLHLASADVSRQYHEARYSLWMCRTDGSGLRELGLLPESRIGFSGLCWTPDGKAICFHIEDAIYTVPVE